MAKNVPTAGERGAEGSCWRRRRTERKRAKTVAEGGGVGRCKWRLSDVYLIRSTPALPSGLAMATKNCLPHQAGVALDWARKLAKIVGH